MSFYRALVTIPSDTTTGEDTVTNTWHFDSDADDHSLDAAGILTKLTAFYQAVDGYMASDLLVPTATVRLYDLSDAPPRVPFSTTTITLTLGTGNALPSECACVLSFRGSAGSGVNMRRRRGRIYLGPLTYGTTFQSGGRVMWEPGFVSAVRTAAIAMRDLTTTPNSKWAVFSPTTLAEGGTLDEAFEDVTNGWVDNAIDIQRRRGTAPTVRSTF